MRARPTALALVAASALATAACQPVERGTIARADAPVVLAGADVPALLGADPGAVVAFRQVRSSGTTTWEQVPVQVDERTEVDFGTHPPVGAVGGRPGTVYGTGPGGVTALQYADADTFVGADPDPALDADDEIAFMLADAGAAPPAGEAPGTPDGVVPGSGAALELTDPATGGSAWIHLFTTDGSLDPGAGRDYVRYDFDLVSGDYAATYRTGRGPNPERSVVRTDAYEARFTDRWMDADWRIVRDGEAGPDLLDGLKSRFSFDTCVRSNVTYRDGEGAFVANIDGPVRAIRSFVGANSGPLTQRTNVFYRSRQDLVTDLRVHAVSGMVEYHDLSEAALGMAYVSETTRQGVAVDGRPDDVDPTVPAWEAYHGDQGLLLLANRIEASWAGTGGWDDLADQFVRDELDSPVAQCWGDDHFIGAAGTQTTGGLPNTDPRTGRHDTLRSTRSIHYATGLPAGVTATQLGDAWSTQLDTPVEVTVHPPRS
jgi:hypothetical protein